MTFWLGYTIMFFNEGFVIMRHVHPWFANKRDHLIATYGAKWKKWCQRRRYTNKISVIPVRFQQRGLLEQGPEGDYSIHPELLRARGRL